MIIGSSLYRGARAGDPPGQCINLDFARELAREVGTSRVIGAVDSKGGQVVIHGCTIGNRCLVGIGSVVLDGVVVEDEVMIGAGSVVTPGKRLTSRGLYLGNPARRVRELTAAEIERFSVVAQHYVDLQREYAAG